MVGLGTIINVAGILVGGVMGLLFGKKIELRFQEILMSAIGVCVLFMGVSGSMEGLLSVEGGALASGGTMLTIGCLCIGALLGEWINVELRMEQMGHWLRAKTKSDGDERFIEGFVTTSLTICIGAMAVVGAVEDGIYGNYTILATKGVIDLILVLVMTVSFGRGCLFAAIPVAVFQGLITLFARVIEPFLSPEALSNLSLMGSILIFCIGINLVFGKKIKVANMLPALVLAVVWAFLPF